MIRNMKFFGSVTVGERGQVVIPADAREELGLSPGDKLLVFKSPFGGGVAVLKPGEFERHVALMNEQASEMKEQIKRENEGSDGQEN